MNIDLSLLIEQKLALLRAIISAPSDEDKELLSGLLNMLDSIHDKKDPPALSQPALAPKDPSAKSDVDAAWVKASAEAILKSGCKMSPNAQTFVGQTFARASQYPTVKFSPKQWEWFNKLMLDAGVESVEMVTLGAPRVDFVNNRGE